MIKTGDTITIKVIRTGKIYTGKIGKIERKYVWLQGTNDYPIFYWKDIEVIKVGNTNEY